MNRLLRDASRLVRSVRERGLRRTVALLPRVIRREYVRQQSRAFDRRYGVRTAGSIATPHGTSTVDSRGYEPISLDWFRRMMAEVDAPLDGYLFVDAGCGLGRAMMLASSYPFSEFVGLEYQDGLAATAQQNLDAFCSATGRARGQFSIVVGDAAEFEWQARPTLLFLYNPFGDQTMRRLLEGVRHAFASSSTDFWVVYRNPVHRSVWDAEPWLESVGGDQHFVVWRRIR